MEPTKEQKSGLSLLYEKLEKQGFKISEPNTSFGENNGTIEITDSQGYTIKQNLHNLSKVYGGLTFYHMSPENAIDEIIESFKLIKKLEI